MPLNIKNSEVERLVAEVAALTGETKTEAVRKALLDRRARLRLRVTDRGRRERVRGFFEREVWARVPPDQLGFPPDKPERERMLGYGEEGV